MIDELLFLLIFALPAGAFLLLLHYCPRWAVRLAVWGSVVVALLTEWLFFSVGSMLIQSELSFLLRALACVFAAVAVPACLLASRIPPLRRRSSKWSLYLLFSMAYGLLFLHGALLLNSVLKQVCPWSEAPLGVELSSAVCALFLFLLLGTLGVHALGAHLDATQRQLRRRSPRKPESPPCPAPKPKRLVLTRRQRRCLLGAGILLALLLPQLCLDFREPKDFPVPVQRELDEMFLSEMQEHRDLFPEEEMAELYHEFTHSGDANVRSDEREWSMLHLACWFSKPELVQYLLQQGADADAATIASQGWAESQPFELAVSNALHKKENIDAARIVLLLLEHGVDIDCQATCGSFTPLYSCALAEDGEAMFLLLLAHGADMMITPTHPYTYIVAQNGWPEALRRLLELGAPLQSDGTHALEGAARGADCPGVYECARMLIEAGEDVNARSGRAGYTPLMALIAAREYNDEDAYALARSGLMVELFLKHGADLHEPWTVSEEAFRYMDGKTQQQERRRMSKTLAEVLKEERPALAAWLTEHGVNTEKP